MRITETESQESIALTKYLLFRRLCFLHVPNEGRRSWQTGRMLKAMGMQRGFHDYLIFNRTRSGAPGMAIELKRSKGGVLAPEQKTMAARPPGARMGGGSGYGGRCGNKDD